MLWSGVAATAAAGFVAAPLLGEHASSIALAPRKPRTEHALLLGVAGYPIAYAIGFTALREATLGTGLILGAAHAGIFGLLAIRQGGTALLRASTGRLLLCLVYGAVLGFAYVTP